MSSLVNSCLICLIPKENDFDRIFTINDSNVLCKYDLAKMYEEVFNLHITADGKYFPEFMCAYCTLQLKLLNKFKKKATDSYQTILTVNDFELNNHKKSIQECVKSEGDILDDCIEELDEEMTSTTTPYMLLDNHENHKSMSSVNNDTHDNLVNQIEIEIQELNYDGIDSSPRIEENIDEQIDEQIDDNIETLNDVIEDCYEVQYLDTESIKDNASSNHLIEDKINIENYDENDDHITIIANFSSSEEGPDIIFDNDEDLTLTCTDNSNHKNYVSVDDDSTRNIKNKSKHTKQKYKCIECNIVFYHKFHLSEHRKSKHPLFKCKICSKRMFTKDGLNSHLKEHQGLPGYKCNECGKTFNQKQHLNYHIQNYHRNERNFQCDFCIKKCLTISDLKIHLRIHNDERRYECDVCHSRFRILTHMKNHRYSHFAKSIECPHCLLKYSSPSTLRTHIRSVHEGICPYECCICQKKFKRKHHMVTHLKTHTKKENILDINECSTDYNQNNNANVVIEEINNPDEH